MKHHVEDTEYMHEFMKLVEKRASIIEQMSTDMEKEVDDLHSKYCKQKDTNKCLKDFFTVFMSAMDLRMAMKKEVWAVVIEEARRDLEKEGKDGVPSVHLRSV